MVVPSRCCCRQSRCIGCDCDSSSQLQINGTWANKICDGCTSLNSGIVVPWVSSLSYIGNGDTCIGGICDTNCDFTKTCYYQTYLTPSCGIPADAYLFCGGNCTADFPCTMIDNCGNGFGEPACDYIGHDPIPGTNFRRAGCDASCTAEPSCDYSAGYTFIDPADGIEKPYGECVGGYGGTISGCAPFILHVRCSVHQHDADSSVVMVSLVVDSQGLQARSGCATFAGKCSDEWEATIDLTDNICLTGLGDLNNCTLPDSITVTRI